MNDEGGVTKSYVAGKRLIDLVVAAAGLIFLSPLLLLLAVLIWLQDFKSPLYVAPRAGLKGETFKVVKLRSMVVDSDRTKVDSTGSKDPRITPVGHLMRRYKLDELTQLWNVFCGQMSLVGPRPNVEREVRLYTQEEQRILSARPGITDIASVVFADEGEILRDSTDPDLDYNQLIRPWKSRLALFWLDNRSLLIDLELLFITALSFLSRKQALDRIHRLLERYGADEPLLEIARRESRLVPSAPPGADDIVRSRSTF